MMRTAFDLVCIFSFVFVVLLYAGGRAMTTTNMGDNEIEIFRIKETDDYDPDEFEPGWYWRTKRRSDEFLEDDARGPFGSKEFALADAAATGATQ